ncbi:EAL domain-containing protein [Amphritea sp. 1_MG-2023]|uniref:putative bifunctional diguanylate cyclase/phosphodiesterase n=1 Tax=Amphritea sp. 1_MG-2023 TaxID=3062670 RepID=UPI0026E3A568|nr:EAL domain-containing protein [Amphritea sp. 1_MG-2023]MDO6562735.1 EAL domain-containing protein [Amphritea sp. 1_MG-2023]
MISKSASLLCSFFLLLLSSSAVAAINLTEDESHWLAQHRGSIRVGVVEVPPYLSNRVNDNRVDGLAMDYLRLIDEALAADFQYQLFDSYAALLNAAQARSIDIVFAASETKERRHYLNFTREYAQLSNKIFAQKDHFRWAKMADFNQQRFAVPRGSALVSYIRDQHPKVNLVEVDTLREAFNLLAAGAVEGVGASASAGYLYSVKEGIDNISIVGNVGLDYHIALAARNDQPILIELLDKGLANITTQQKQSIDDRWLHPEDSQRIDIETLKQWLLFIGFGLTVVLLLMLLLWNRSLKREVSYRKEIQKEVSFLAYHDELTGTYNRQFMTETLAEYTRLPCTEAQTTCVILLGLDNFSLINEFYGQKIGDYVLRRTSERLQARLSGGSVLSRNGGDEFAVVLRQSADRLSLSHFADRLIAEMSLPIVSGDQSFALTATAGISIQTAELDDPLRLLEQADLALHEAKKKNAGSYLFYASEMSDQLYENQQLVFALAEALSSDQFYLEYQPQMALLKDEVVGFEALARWQHPQMGNIPPDKFILLAEQEGLIVTLGDRVLQLACQQGCVWLAQGLVFQRIAVNVSVKQFVESDFASKVLNTLEQSGFPAEKLELEITESVFLGDLTQAKETMSKLTHQGVCFSIDDFGTGFSSLLYLKELPVLKLKLDQGFIQGITHDHSSLQIVKASLQMGSALNMDVIVEGVETREEYQTLVNLKCEHAQGYLFSRPLKPQLITAKLLSQITQSENSASRTEAVTEAVTEA